MTANIQDSLTEVEPTTLSGLAVASCEHFPDIPLPEEWAMKIVDRIIRNKRGLLNAFPHLRPENGDDMRQEMFIAIRDAWAGFDVNKMASTFIGTVVSRRIIDTYKRAKVRAKNEQGYYRLRGDSYRDGEAEQPETPSMAEWLAGVCLVVRRQYPDRLWSGSGSRGSGKDRARGIVGYSLDQLLGLYALQVKLKLKPFGVYTMLKEFPELRRALRIRKTLPVKSVYRLLDRAKREVDKCGFSTC